MLRPHGNKSSKPPRVAWKLAAVIGLGLLMSCVGPGVAPLLLPPPCLPNPRPALLDPSGRLTPEGLEWLNQEKLCAAINCGIIAGARGEDVTRCLKN